MSDREEKIQQHQRWTEGSGYKETALPAPPANCVAEVRPFDLPECEVCGAVMLPTGYKCQSCGGETMSERKHIYEAGTKCWCGESAPSAPPAAPTDEQWVLAKELHNVYEQLSVQYGWKTQEQCQVPFERLPHTNRQVMLGMADFVLARAESELHAEAVCDCHTWPTIKEFHEYTVAVEAENQRLRDEVRPDVREFAKMMSVAMDSKAIERDSRKEPHYLSPDYPLSDAIARLQDKTDQLVYDITNRPDHERTLKTAVHLANFCMIIVAKLRALSEKGSKS